MLLNIAYLVALAQAVSVPFGFDSSFKSISPFQRDTFSNSNSNSNDIKYEVLTQYFQQDDPDTDDSTFVVTQTLGLNDNTTWSQLISDLTELNQQSNHKKYKLFFLQRHGEGWHNVAPSFYGSDQWSCYWQVLNGNGTVEWYDAELTPGGVSQLTSFEQVWTNAINTDGAPTPQSYYVSPLRRTLQTWNLLWNKLASGKPTIKELARETYGIGTESKHHNKEYISKTFPFAEFESGFQEFDKSWVPDQHESSEHRNYRAQQLLNDIFTNDDNQVISLVSHSGLIKSILKVVNHRKWSLSTGSMVPVVIKANTDKSGESFDLSGAWSTFQGCSS